MKTIKFRAWHKKENQWVYFHDIAGIFHASRIANFNDLENWGQFTGLLDKNGKEIYEGDILRVPPKNEWEKINYGCYEVFFHDGDGVGSHIGFVMNRSHYHGSITGGWVPAFLPKITKLMEVIGNIYQNPELIK